MGFFSFRHRIQTVSGRPPPATGALFPGVKWLEREADHSPPSSTEVNNAWSYNSTPQYFFIAWCEVKLYLYFHIPLSTMKQVTGTELQYHSFIYFTY